MYLQDENPFKYVLPHARLHVKLRQFLVCLSAGRPHLLTRRDILGEIKDVTRGWGTEC